MSREADAVEFTACGNCGSVHVRLLDQRGKCFAEAPVAVADAEAMIEQLCECIALLRLRERPREH